MEPDRHTSRGEPGTERSRVPLGQAIDDRPAPKRSRAATNDAADRRRAFLLIGSLIGAVLLVVVLGNTVLRPIIVEQRENTLIRITNEQVESLAEIADDHYRATGIIPSGFAELHEDERLETSKGRDLWGTPFALSTDTEPASGRPRLSVRSAGPDGAFQTEDDLVAVRILGDSDPAGTED